MKPEKKKKESGEESRESFGQAKHHEREKREGIPGKEENHRIKKCRGQKKTFP